MSTFRFRGAILAMIQSDGDGCTNHMGKPSAANTDARISCQVSELRRVTMDYESVGLRHGQGWGTMKIDVKAYMNQNI